MSQEKKLVVVAGLPGASKTWSTREALKDPELGDVASLSVGSILRDVVSGYRKSSLTREVLDEREKLAAGECLPTSVVSAVISEALDDYEYSQLVLLDGYPRTEQQAHELDKLAFFTGRTLAGVLLFDISDETSRDRMLHRSARLAEGPVTEAFIEQRHQDYTSQTVPAIECLKYNYALPIFPINAEQDKHDTAFQTTNVIRSILTSFS